jgi:DNA-binding MarR family transcriptional regulator
VTIQFKPVSADNVSLLKSTLEALNLFKNLRDTMPLQCVAAFLLVASEEGLNVNAYAKRAGIRPPLMTRHLADLGTTNRYHEAGFGLVEQYDNVLDRRERLIRLTAKGRNMVREICEAFAWSSSG